MAVDLAASPLGSQIDTRVGTEQLAGVPNCPYCGVSSPILKRVWWPNEAAKRGDGGVVSEWAAYQCTSCAGVVTAMGIPGITRKQGHTTISAVRMFPAGRTVSAEVPSIPATFLRQAFATLHAPDAAAVMAGSAVDAMLKEFGYSEGSLYKRIDEAKDAGLLTTGMADWAHSVRLGSNRPRHVDREDPHVSPRDAQRSVSFAEALGNFLFVLTAQIQEAVEQVGQAVEAN